MTTSSSPAGVISRSASYPRLRNFFQLINDCGIASLQGLFETSKRDNHWGPGRAVLMYGRTPDGLYDASERRSNPIGRQTITATVNACPLPHDRLAPIEFDHLSDASDVWSCMSTVARPGPQKSSPVRGHEESPARTPFRSPCGVGFSCPGGGMMHFQKVGPTKHEKTGAQCFKCIRL